MLFGFTVNTFKQKWVDSSALFKKKTKKSKKEKEIKELKKFEDMLSKTLFNGCENEEDILS